MVYADYTFYKQIYMGNMPEVDFPRLARPASTYLDQITFDRIQSGWEDAPYAEKIRMACCAVADAMCQQEQGGEVVSATNDGYSETYVTSSRTPEQKLLDAVRMYLGNTGLMYRGVD